ncbi:MAG: hypothetical protein EPN91_10825 [Salinibacterium sp.]|nr:MAG: hypothetical protein EPN91_10825 [Salinibacterium sp.]
MLRLRAGDRVGTPDYDVPDGWVRAIRRRIGEGAAHVEWDVVVLHDDGTTEEWPVMRRDGDHALRRVRGAPRLSMFDHPVPSVAIVVQDEPSPPRRKRKRKLRKRS